MTENFVYKNDNLVPSFTEHVESVESWSTLNVINMYVCMYFYSDQHKGYIQQMIFQIHKR